MTWDDIPLLKYESELLVKTGAWKSLLELEESLTLDVLFLLYRASNYEFSMSVKAYAAGMGAEVDWYEDWYEQSEPEAEEVLESNDLRFIPFGLGYEA